MPLPIFKVPSPINAKPAKSSIIAVFHAKISHCHFVKNKPMTEPSQSSPKTTKTPKATLPTAPLSQTDQAEAERVEVLRVAEQNAQARLVLIQLQWLITILLLSAILWLGNNQRKLEMAVNERLKITEEFSTRLNDMDDRLFALTPIAPPQKDQARVENDLQLIRIQLVSAEQLYQAGNYKATESLLQSVLWQLGSERITIATPLKSALIENIKADLEHLSALKSLPDVWQSHVIKMQEIQAYLRQSTRQSDELNRQDLVRHDATIMLSLAIGAGTLRERDTMTSYLNETLANLELLQKITARTSRHADDDGNGDDNDDGNGDKTADKNSENILNDDITSLPKAIYALNELLANPPKITPLSSLQLLK